MGEPKLTPAEKYRKTDKCKIAKQKYLHKLLKKVYSALFINKC